MPRKKEFSFDEIVKIWKMKAEGKNIDEIVMVIGRSKPGIYSVIRKGENWHVKHRTGRKKVTSGRQDRRIVQLASNSQKSVRQISRIFEGKISKSTVHNRLKAVPTLVYSKMSKQPKLTTAHKQARLEWARNHMTWKNEWHNILFSDEKKWNLDGPDGWAYYWHDLRKEPQSFFSHQQGGGSLMVWGAFGLNGKSQLAFIDGRQTSADYQNTLKNHLLPVGQKIGGNKWIFQQDNASIHRSGSTISWIKSKKIRLMEWPARSPDLNPIENLWGIISRQVYANNRQFSNVSELRQEIERSWNNLSKDTLKNLINSMEKRIFELIMTNGKFIGY